MKDEKATQNGTKMNEMKIEDEMMDEKTVQGEIKKEDRKMEDEIKNEKKMEDENMENEENMEDEMKMRDEKVKNGEKRKMEDNPEIGEQGQTQKVRTKTKQVISVEVAQCSPLVTHYPCPKRHNRTRDY